MGVRPPRTSTPIKEPPPLIFHRQQPLREKRMRYRLERLVWPLQQQPGSRSRDNVPPATPYYRPVRVSLTCPRSPPLEMEPLRRHFVDQLGAKYGDPRVLQQVARSVERLCQLSYGIKKTLSLEPT